MDIYYILIKIDQHPYQAFNYFGTNIDNNFYDYNMKKKVWKINRTVLPQHSDHAGVMWHGTYFNWLEEARINAFFKSGINYFDLTKKGFELPLLDASIKYILPLYLGDNITIESLFSISKSPKIKINSKFINQKKKLSLSQR